MSPEQTAAVVTVCSVMVWPAWQGAKELAWKVIDHLWPDTNLPPAYDRLNEKDETWGAPADDDLMAVAEAVGATPIDPVALVEWHTPSASRVTDEDFAMFVGWSQAAAGSSDHAVCQHEGCDLVLCRCPWATACLGTVDAGCGHTGGLCDEHRGDCVDCRIDAGVRGRFL